eukprot:6479298-Amphidinium_carterae.1
MVRSGLEGHYNTSFRIQGPSKTSKTQASPTHIGMDMLHKTQCCATTNTDGLTAALRHTRSRVEECRQYPFSSLNMSPWCSALQWGGCQHSKTLLRFS